MKSFHKLRYLHRSGVFVAVLGFLYFGAHTASADQKSPVQMFPGAVGMAGECGDIEGDLIEPGDIFPPSNNAFGRLKRKKDRMELEIKTDGLPAGAYTVWWVVFNNPDACSDGICGDGPDDLFNPAVETSVFFATGGIVEDEGGGLGSACFQDVHFVGEHRGAKGLQDIIPVDGPGTPIKPKKAEVHNIIKYHGAPSDDPYTLHDQLTTLLGSCAGPLGTCEGGMANAVDTMGPFGIQCFDPQFVAFMAPGKKGKKDDDDDDD